MVGSRAERRGAGRPLDDGAVVARVLAGDQAAFELLMRRHNERLYRVAWAVLGRDADAQDALQEAYLRAYRALSGFDGRSAVSTWLTRIVFREAVRVREARAMPPGRIAAVAGPLEREHPEEGPTMDTRPNASPNASLDREDVLARFDAALATLGDRERAIVVLRWVQGLSTRQTALGLGISESSVKVTLHRARPKLAKSMDARAAGSVRRGLSFDGARCDRLVARVLAAIAREPGGGP